MSQNIELYIYSYYKCNLKDGKNGYLPNKKEEVLM